jgi:hypothetical protein
MLLRADCRMTAQLQASANVARRSCGDGCPGCELELIVDHVGEAQLAVEIRAQR